MTASGTSTVPAPKRPWQSASSTAATAPFFAYHAEYARVTMAEQPPATLMASTYMRRLIDTRLMATFAKALEEKGS